ncbi:MAG: hypothetical protein KF905_14880 [Flavobacteriales bacterium]|nr:hypothetical protein [Flavobacteriales bacterium]
MQGMWVELTQERPLFDNIRAFVAAFHEAMVREPHFPHFMLNELQRDPQHLLKLVDLGKGAREQFFKQVKAAQQRGEIIAIEPLQLMVNMMAWCWFPHVASPVVRHLGGMDQKAFERFLQERSSLAAELIIRSIQQ